MPESLVKKENYQKGQKRKAESHGGHTPMAMRQAKYSDEKREADSTQVLSPPVCRLFPAVQIRRPQAQERTRDDRKQTAKLRERRRELRQSIRES